MQVPYLFITLLLPLVYGFQQYSPFFNQWHCIGIKQNIDFSKPYTTNIGDLPLVVWKHNDKYSANVNICKHMGSKLDHSKITSEGCLKCPYHGYEYVATDTFGETMEFEGKIFWAYKPTQKQPFSVPLFNSPNYETSFIQVDMFCSLPDSAYNTMDLLHPAFVHNNVFGFGSTVPPENVKMYPYHPKDSMIGLSFDYASNSIVMRDSRMTKNYHLFRYPTFGWSRVTTDDKNLIIGANFQPIDKKRTRWYITICHNYFKSPLEKQFMKVMATAILSQDFGQMLRQYTENDLKRELMFNYKFDKEEVVLNMNEWFKQNYVYPSVEECVKLYQDSKPKSP
jgi:nitrite reductase/ring-hydroxylating ferredoxin subunit